MKDWSVLEDTERALASGRRTIGAGIRSARLGLWLTQQQLGWRVGGEQSTISRLETGKSQGMRYSTLCRLVGIIQLSPGYRFPGGPPPPRRRLPGQRRLRRSAS
jgi:transcriptional regulator with XRE-family HTH domain